MKEFKKWKNKVNASTTWLEGAEKGWRAALKCVRDKMLSNCHEPMDIYDFIGEELEE